jgi:hypothetical protein
MFLWMLILNPFFEFWSAACSKKGFKKQAAIQMLGPSYFVRALEKNKGQFGQDWPSKLDYYYFQLADWKSDTMRKVSVVFQKHLKRQFWLVKISLVNDLIALCQFWDLKKKCWVRLAKSSKCICGIHTPNSWLVCVFRSSTNPHEPNLQNLGTRSALPKAHEWRNYFTYAVIIA